jgi:hypothetical protein
MKKRNHYSAEHKAKVAWREEATVNKIAAKYGTI